MGAMLTTDLSIPFEQKWFQIKTLHLYTTALVVNHMLVRPPIVFIHSSLCDAL